LGRYLIKLGLCLAHLGMDLEHLVKLLSRLVEVHLLHGTGSGRLLLLDLLRLVVGSHETEGLLHVFQLLNQQGTLFLVLLES